MLMTTLLLHLHSHVLAFRICFSQLWAVSCSTLLPHCHVYMSASSSSQECLSFLSPWELQTVAVTHTPARPYGLWILLSLNMLLPWRTNELSSLLRVLCDSVMLLKLRIWIQRQTEEKLTILIKAEWLWVSRTHPQWAEAHPVGFIRVKCNLITLGVPDAASEAEGKGLMRGFVPPLPEGEGQVEWDAIRKPCFRFKHLLLSTYEIKPFKGVWK